ncbi:cation diffusion facilitator family transporter [uncultured Rikenella sp.]|uniref:cation diffusion facilitator family transporter n=1 Tax=uncultured Rikenella sp. TaxID=368003 RepID=UPI0026095B03|nr:cation diffusion facilitator family transporter [uncultured Rikenella sp.]
MIDPDKVKQRVQAGLVILSAGLMAGKFLAFFLTDSVGILTDAMESIVNVTAGLITLYSLHLAAKPQDAGHPFGHGKAELISASAEGLMIAAAGVLILIEAVRRLFEPSMPQRLDVGIVVVAASGLANWIAGWYSIRMGRRYDSIALVAGGKHLQSDTWSTVGLVAGLLLLYFTRIPWIDSALALIFGTLIGITGIQILRKTIGGLMDKADRQVLERIVRLVSEHRQTEWIDVHNLKAIRYGSLLYVDCDLTLPWYYNIAQGHDASEALKNTLKNGFGSRVLVSIHSDSCREKHCAHCQVCDCPYRRQPFRELQPLDVAEMTKNDETRTAEGEE